MRTWTGAETGQFLKQVVDHRFGAPICVPCLHRLPPRRGVGVTVARPQSGRRTAEGQHPADRDESGRTNRRRDHQANQGRRLLVLNTQLVDDLRAHRRRQSEQRLLLGAGWRDNDLVFPNPLGEAQPPETVSRVFRELVDKAGLPPIRLDDLRHGWATLVLQAGIHPKVVQERFGHATIAITLGTYSHVAPAMHEGAAVTGRRDHAAPGR